MPPNYLQKPNGLTYKWEIDTYNIILVALIWYYGMQSVLRHLCLLAYSGSEPLLFWYSSWYLQLWVNILKFFIGILQ